MLGPRRRQRPTHLSARGQHGRALRQHLLHIEAGKGKQVQSRLCCAASSSGCRTSVSGLTAALLLDRLWQVGCGCLRLALPPGYRFCRSLPRRCCCKVGWGVVLEVLSQQAQAVASCHAGIPVAVAQVARHGCHD